MFSRLEILEHFLDETYVPPEDYEKHLRGTKAFWYGLIKIRKSKNIPHWRHCWSCGVALGKGRKKYCTDRCKWKEKYYRRKRRRAAE